MGPKWRRLTLHEFISWSQEKQEALLRLKRRGVLRIVQIGPEKDEVYFEVTGDQGGVSVQEFEES